MKHTDVVYIGIGLHSNTGTIGYMNHLGEYCGHHKVQTKAQNLVNQVTAIPGKVKKITLEQSNMAFWAGELLQDYFNELIVCDPRHNSLISRGENKNDGLDTLALCRLLRLGQLREVWRPKKMGLRRMFFHQVKEYHRLSKAGHGVLKNLAHTAWKTNLHTNSEIDRYYGQQLERTGNLVHARLATQRKILITMWALWKNKACYDPDRFTYNGRGGSTR